MYYSGTRPAILALASTLKVASDGTALGEDSSGWDDPSVTAPMPHMPSIFVFRLDKLLDKIHSS